MPNIVLIRHLATDLAGRFCGQIDPAINTVGQSQLRTLADSLRIWKINYIYTSDLQRARQTAEAINMELGVPFTPRSGLREISFGKWEGLSWEEIERQDAVMANLWLKKYPHQPAPGGEAYTEFSLRIQAEAELLFQFAKERRVAAVTHAGVIREILMRYCSVSSEAAWEWTREYGAFVVIDDQRKMIFTSIAGEVKE